MAKDKQKEFKIMPERTKLGKKAIEYLNIRDEMEKKKEELDSVKTELVELFQAEGKTSIRVEGYTVSFAHLENDKITVKETPFG